MGYTLVVGSAARPNPRGYTMANLKATATAAATAAAATAAAATATATAIKAMATAAAPSNQGRTTPAAATAAATTAAAAAATAANLPKQGRASRAACAATRAAIAAAPNGGKLPLRTALVQATGAPYAYRQGTHRHAMYLALQALYAQPAPAGLAYGKVFAGATGKGIKYGDSDLGFCVTNGYLKVVRQ